MSRNLHIYQSDIAHESRLRRHCEALWENKVFDDIAYIGSALKERKETFGENFPAYLLEKQDTRKKGLIAKLLATRRWGSHAYQKAIALSTDCITCHSLPVLPICVRAKKTLDCRLVYEPHELETESTVSRGLRQIMAKRLERKLIGYCDEVITVCDSISDWYADAYSIPRPKVVRNTPKEYPSIDTSNEKNILRTQFKIPEQALLFIYQGYLGRGRRIEQYLDVFKKLDSDYQIVFMGNGDFEAQVKQASSEHANIHYQDAVPPEQVIQYTRCADVGLCGVENICLSYYYSLPNKIFEYLAAGIPCLVPDFPEMRRVLNETGCGWLHEESNEKLQRSITSIRREEVAQKASAAVAAKEVYCWKNESKAIVSAYRNVMR